MKKPEERDIVLGLEYAKALFLRNDIELLTNNSNERSLTHKFAEYLQVSFPDFNVDCEYNRSGGDPKSIDVVQSVVGKTSHTSSLVSKTVYPDIIIHKRGLNGPNLIVIEAKKTPDHIGRENDVRKLYFLKKQHDYEYCAFLGFEIDSQDINIEINPSLT